MEAGRRTGGRGVGLYEVAQAVKRENLIIDTVFAMHQGPMPWEKVLELIEKSRHSPAA